jgi:hypothetical protein
VTDRLHPIPNFPVIPGVGAAAPQTRDLSRVEDRPLRLIERLDLHTGQVPALRGCRRSGRDDGQLNARSGKIAA